ncbi:MAG: PAS domain S-box protein, partial [Rhodomicrobium sp.]
HKRVLTGEEVACDEDPVPRTDGRTDWVRWSMKPWRDPNGKIRGALLFKEVITAEIEAREKLASREALFRETFENAAVGIAHIAPNGRWLLVNPRLCKITGYSAVELLTKTVKDVTHPDDFEAHLPQIKRMYRGGIDSLDMEKRYVHKDGSIVWVKLRISCARKDGGAIDHIIAVIVDISQQKKAEIALRKSEERFRGIFKRAGTGIAIMDLCGRFQSCNPAYSAMLGYTEEELRELICADLIHPSDCAANKIQQDRLVAGYIPSFEIVSRYLSKEGSILWGHRYLSLLRDEAGRPTHIMALVTNITERKQHEDQVSLLLREVNHRSKNMLSVVQAIARQTAAKTPGDFIGRFGERIQALAASQDLLVKNEWRGASLGEVVKSQLAHFRDLIGTRIELSGPPVFVSAAAAQIIGLVMHELATNAGKYGALINGDGQVKIEWGLEPSEAGEATFRMSWREEGGPPVSVPCHSGFGSTVICHLAEMSLDAKIDLGFAVTGLSWRLSCRAEDVLEGGRFARSSGRPEPAGASASVSTRSRVLVVEDEPFVGMEIAQVLDAAGFDVAGPVAGAMAALDLLKRGRCDAAVLDIHLGGETSEPVALQLIESEIPFVTLSGYSREQYPPAFKSAPALMKPLRPELLIVELKRCIDEQRKKAERRVVVPA